LLTYYRSGASGIVQLEVLGRIEEAIGLQVPIREFFDLMIGTKWVLSDFTLFLLLLMRYAAVVE
jgi:hypothetical protein